MPLNNQILPFNKQVKTVLIILAVVTLVEVLNLFSQRWFNQFGLLPRDINHLIGIFTSPFLHGSFSHYLSNILPLAVFSLLMLQYGTKRFALVSLWIIVASGLLVWLFGRTAYHVGASGLIYGYFGFLILAGFMAKKLKLILISLLVGFVYGGLVYGVLPSDRFFVSWEYHLFGFITGLIAARYWVRKRTTASH
ncbi:rhomboid family intramembrane serine protease [Neptunicella sp. SCSIO 80796]|uniref:rhomboid family intramembrane serine protease n=1 Tax=Neptunicella plasticusilytica TaxID=3117012 RepID=UPI003A4E1886